MATVTIPQKEYERLKQYSSAYMRIAKEIARAELAYPYDYSYIRALTRGALTEHRKGKSIIASSVDEALKRFRRKRK